MRRYLATSRYLAPFLIFTIHLLLQYLLPSLQRHPERGSIFITRGYSYVGNTRLVHVFIFVKMQDGETKEFLL
jgi:hypothetical protein